VVVELYGHAKAPVPDYGEMDPLVFHIASPDQILYCRYGIAKKSIPFDTTQARELEVRSPLAYAKSFKCPARLYYGTKEKHFEKTTQRTAAVAKEKGLDVVAAAVEGDHMSAVPAAMKLSIAFFEKRR
jgi:hypothetical protein